MNISLDLRHALRLLRSSPKMTALTLLVVSGGLAVSLFTFSFLYTIVYKPLPLPEQESLYRAALRWDSRADGASRYFPNYEFQQFRSRQTSFAELGAWQTVTVSLMFENEAVLATGARVDTNIFDVSRTPPLLGRTFQSADSDAGASAVAVISEAVWQTHFAGDPAVIGRVVQLNGEHRQIVGVMPHSYKFPIAHDIWLPFTAEQSSPTSGDKENVDVYGRLKPGVSVAAATAEMHDLSLAAFQTRGESASLRELKGAEILPFQRFDIGPELRQMFIALNLIALLILMLACINTGNLLFARTLSRNKESAVRAAIGATPMRLMIQMMWEGVILCVAGAVLALLVVAFLLRLVHLSLHSLIHGELAFWYRWELDTPTVVGAIVYTLLTIAITSGVPAWRAATQNFNMVLRDGTRGAQGKKAGRLSRMLVTTQIFLVCTVMLLGTVTLLKVHQVTRFDTGIAGERLYYAGVDLPEALYPTPEARAQLLQSLYSQLREQPEFSAVGVQFVHRTQSFGIEGVDYAQESDKPKASVLAFIGEPSFIGLRLLDGRYLDGRDNATGAPAVIVSESAARRFWPDKSPLGMRLTLSLDGTPVSHTVVGVVSNTAGTPFETHDQYDEIYASGLQHPLPAAHVMFKYADSATEAERKFLSMLYARDNNIRLRSLQEYSEEKDAIGRMAEIFRNVMIGSCLFAALLAASGIYALTFFALTRRTQEIGLRRALGATESAIVRMLLIEGRMRLIVGLGGAVVLCSAIFLAVNSFLDLPLGVYVLTTAVVAGLLVATVFAAIVVPARASLRTEPAVALHHE